MSYNDKLLKHAQWYAGHGLPVFPCPPKSKKPLKDSNGFRDATTDPEQVAAWWDGTYLYNIGIATGTGVVVLDVDVHPDKGKFGDETLRDLEAQYGPLPDTWTCLTGGGAGCAHYYFACDDPALTCATDFLPGLDYRGNGGYVIAPPSTHECGQEYEWEAGHTPGNTPLAPLPDWLHTLMLKGRETAPEARTEAARIAEGSRNDTLFRLACSLRGKGMTVEGIIAALLAENKARCDPPLPDREVEKIAKSGGKYPPGSFGGFGGHAHNENENGFCGFCGFCGPDLSKNPKFPAVEFPPVLRNFTVNASASLQVAIDMTSVSSFAVSSLCAQRKFKVHTQNNWFEPVNLYTVVVANPSEKKSPTLSLVMNPVYRFEREENERRRPQVEEYRDKRDMLQRRIESLKKSATSTAKKAKNDSPATAEDIRLLRLEMEDLEKDAIDYISLTADDITMEALVSKMVANNETMALVASEGGIFNVMSGLYSSGMVNIDIILKAWSGDHVEVDRKNRAPETLLNPSLVILLMAQPKVLEEVMKSVEFAGRGLNARFLYAIPASPVGTRTFKAPPIPQDVIDEYDDLIRRLLAIPDTGEPRIIEMTDEARNELEKIHNEIEPRLGPGGDLEPLGDWAGKYVGTVVRIAGMLHICEYIEEAAEVPIPGETVRRAGEIGKYFLAHAICAYQLSGQMDDQPTKDAKYILKRLDSTGKTEIKKKDLFDLCKDRVGLETVEKMEPGLDVLVKRGYIKIEKAPNPQNPQNPQKGGRPSYMIYVNPIYTKMKEGGKL